MKDEKTIVRFNDVFLGYGRNIVLRNLNFEIEKGDFVGIIGPNGSGKTTILRALLGLVLPVKGNLIKDKRIRYSYVQQRQYLDPVYPFTVAEIVMMGRFPQMGFFAVTEPEDIEKMDNALKMTGVLELKKRLFRELSEGQKQRVLLARALVSDPDVLLLDEPTNDLDIRGHLQIMGLLEQIHENMQVTIIMVSHLLEAVLNYASNVIFLNQKEIKLYNVESICEQNLLPEIYGVPIEIKKINSQYVIMTGGANVRI